MLIKISNKITTLDSTTKFILHKKVTTINKVDARMKSILILEELLYFLKYLQVYFYQIKTKPNRGRVFKQCHITHTKSIEDLNSTL